MMADVVALGELVRGSRLLTGADCEPYRHDASQEPGAQPLAVLLAQSVQDVAAALAWASSSRVPVVARGAGTGVVGGALPLQDCLVISTEAMSRILTISAADRLAVVQPGVVVDEINRAVAGYGLMYAPDPASSATATIGGTIATNAGGLRCLRYGVTADSVAALQVVLADGRVMRTGAGSRKNVAGLDLVHLFVGSEGTLGVVTEATVRLRPLPVGHKRTFRVAFPSLLAAGEAVSSMTSSGVEYEVLELIDRTTAEFIDAFSPGLIDPDAAATVVGQVIAPDADELLLRTRSICDAVQGFRFAVATDDSLLVARRNAFPALAAHGMGVQWVASDAAVPPSKLAALLEAVRGMERMSGRRISVVAHAGDGNIHAAIATDVTDPDDVSAADEVARAIARAAVALGGTPTGEHGIGSLKTKLLDDALDDTARDVHHRIKRALDPQNILNPGRAIPTFG